MDDEGEINKKKSPVFKYGNTSNKLLIE